MTTSIYPQGRTMTETDTDILETPSFHPEIDKKDIGEMRESAGKAAVFLKTLGHEGRLMILCFLSSGEKSVAELEKLLSVRQAAVSQQLSRLRYEGIIKPRREGKMIFYSLTDAPSKDIIDVMYRHFCK